MERILGIDPGSRITGYGMIEIDGFQPRAVLFGTVNLDPSLSLPDRLFEIHHRLRAVMDEYLPDVVAVETAFYHKNVRSTLVLGQVRGVVLLAARETAISLAEYAPRDIKAAVTGNGGAEKAQVAFMIKGLLGLKEKPAADAADALAVALCHWHRAKIRSSG